MIFRANLISSKTQNFLTAAFELISVFRYELLFIKWTKALSSIKQYLNAKISWNFRLFSVNVNISSAKYVFLYITDTAGE